MKTLVKVEIAAAVISFVLIFVCGLIGQSAIRSGVDEKTAATMTRSAIMLLFVIFAFSSMGLLLHVFIVLQFRIGNAGLPMVRFLAARETGVTLAMWGILGLGTVIALPFILQDLAGIKMSVGRSQGILVADIGMTFEEVKAHSTITVKEPTAMYDGSRRAVEEKIFDYQIGNSAVVFPQSRYYWLETGKNDPHLIALNIGITPQKMPRPELAAFQRQLQEKLLANGWMPGHFLARSEETVRLWGGQHTAGDGRYWARGNTLLIFETNRMDEEKQGEPAGSGEFILYIDLRPKNHEPELVYENSAWKK